MTSERIARARRRLLTLRSAGRVIIRRYLPDESQYLFALTLTIGAVCGLVAVIFHLAIQATEGLLIERALHAPGSSWMVWTIVSPTVGGLLAGAALTWLVPGARGSGIPQVKQAFAVEGGRIRFRDALGKFVIGAVQIGSGASLGREGPTVQICAGATSLLARASSFSIRNMRRLTPVGVAAGIAAAFNAPIAAVTFTIEEIVGTLDQAVLSGVVIAAALAAVIERGILGGNPVIKVEQSYGLDHASSLILYAVLGIAAAIVSVAFTESLLRARLWFRSLRAVPAWMHPAIGGLVTGSLAVVMLRFFATTGVTGGGYETLGHALAGKITLPVLVLLCVVKLVATVCSYSSGGAGGIFAPALFVGAMLGGAVGNLDVVLLHHENQQLGAFALVGMGAVFAGVIRAPITSVLIIFEMTGGYGLVLPLMLANMSSYILARRLRPTPIYEALLEQDGVLLPNAVPPKTHVLDQLSVADAMTSNVISGSPDQTVADAVRLVANGNFSFLPIVQEQELLGAIAIHELRNPGLEPRASIRSLIRPNPVVRSDTSLVRAIVRMNDLGTRQLFVVDATGPTRLVGVLSMSDVVRAHGRVAPSSTQTAVSLRPELMLELQPISLMLTAIVIEGGSKLPLLAAQLRDGASAFVLRRGELGYAVILPEQLHEFARDEDLEKMLIADDLAQPAPSIAGSASLSSLIRVMQSSAAEAAVVLDESNEPLGIVTKTALARAFLERYVSRSEPPPRA